MTHASLETASDSEIVIDVRDVTKTYRIYRKPSDRLKGFFFRRVPSEDFNALEGVSLSVNQGRTLGVIGENGAGKSTLLKILSSTLTPTSGHVMINGTVLSILELGVGFHPEFTGRENIFFYGDVLGFSRNFIKQKTDEIIAFSELGHFIDKPVRTYSSGMFMRLAFSIVSSLEPDILILDEVLAVGDIHFQTKSLNRILDFKKTGKTILFCSHDTYHVRMICDHVIWLRDGRIYLEGEPEQVVCAYESYQFQKGETRGETQISDRPVLIESLELKHAGNLSTGDTMQLCLNTLVSNPDLSYNIMLSLKLPDGRGVYVTGTHLNQAGTLKGNRIITIMFPSIRLLSGNYYFHARIFDEAGLILYHEKATPFFTVGKRLQDLGICSVENEWSIA